MVLADSQNGLPDSEYAGPHDPQQSNNELQVKYNNEVWRINLDKLHSSIFAPGVEYYKRQETAQSLASPLMSARKILDRPLRQDEIDALSYISSKRIATVMASQPLGVLASVGYCFAYKRNAYNFPFWDAGKKPWFNENKLGPLKDAFARSTWKAARYVSWNLAFTVGLGLFLSSFASSVDAADTARDNRLQAFRDAKAKKYQEAMASIKQQRTGQSAPIETAQGQMDRGVIQAQANIDRMRNRGTTTSTSKYGDDDDDMSPTGGAFSDDFEQSSPASDGGLMSDSQLQMSERRQEYEKRAEEQYNNVRPTQAPRQARQQQQSQDSDDPFGPARETPTSSGSAWDRIRQQATAKQPQGNHGGVQRGQSPVAASTPENDFTFSKGEEDRQLAKSEAQREFDARVERERQGGDFNDRSNRRW